MAIQPHAGGGRAVCFVLPSPVDAANASAFSDEKPDEGFETASARLGSLVSVYGTRVIYFSQPAGTEFILKQWKPHFD